MAKHCFQLKPVEKYARQRLYDLGLFNADTLEGVDKPDLQEISGKIGIEVVEECNPQMKEDEAFFSDRMCHKNVLEVDCKKFLEHGGDIWTDAQGIILGCGYGNESSDTNKVSKLILILCRGQQLARRFMSPGEL